MVSGEGSQNDFKPAKSWDSMNFAFFGTATYRKCKKVVGCFFPYLLIWVR